MNKKHLKLTVLLVGIFSLGFLFRHIISFVIAQEGVIHGCVRHQSGIIRIIDSDQKCQSNETPLNWNMQGPPGPSGSLSYPFVCVGCVREIGSRLANRDLTGSYIQYTTLIENDLSNTNFTNAAIVENNLWNCNFQNANLTNANVTDTNFKGSDFTGATLTGVTWSNTTCPDGTNSDANGKTCEGHLTPVRAVIN